LFTKKFEQLLYKKLTRHLIGVILKKAICILAIFCFYAIFHHNPAYAEDCQAAEITEIAPGVYVRPGHYGTLFQDQALANIGFIVGRECVAVIDSGGSAVEGAGLSCAIRNVSKVPVCYVIISHHHPDHALGSSAFKAENHSVRLLGHANLERALAISGNFFLQRLQQRLGQKLDESYIVMPDQTVTPGQPLQLDLGDRVLQITAYPPAHTDNDLSVYDEQTGTLWLADLLFVEHIPAIDASAKGWLQVLNDLTHVSAQRAVPGHGPVSVAWPGAADDIMRYLSVLRKEIRKLLDDGIDLEEAQETAGYSEQTHWQQFEEYHKRNVSKVYTEMEWED
jgi:quinoprotein relay system zinc metallohydrolase 2